jgi:hypothetical protein
MKKIKNNLDINFYNKVLKEGKIWHTK